MRTFFLLQSVDLTELAREGKLDPTIGRDEGMYCGNDVVVMINSMRLPLLPEIRRTIQSKFSTALLASPSLEKNDMHDSSFCEEWTAEREKKLAISIIGFVFIELNPFAFHSSSFPMQFYPVEQSQILSYVSSTFIPQ